MSYDINFWKLERPLSDPPVVIYRRVCRASPSMGLLHCQSKICATRFGSFFRHLIPT